MTEVQIIEAAVAVLLFIAVRLLVNRSIDRIVEKNNAAKTRSKIVRKAIHLTVILIFIIILLSILGVNQSELFVFIGSVLTVIGIALFAQWSILSNITAGIILFFNHSVKLDDTVSIIDKDYEIEGRISDIGLFFVILKMKDNEQITIPNNVFLNKMIKKKPHA